MGWNINLIDNTLVVPAAAVAEIKALKSVDAFWVYDEDASPVDEDMHLVFDDDAMEHMDYMWNEEIQEVLTRHKANGEVIFNSSQGDNRGLAWGYRFTDGEFLLLAGKAKNMKLTPVK